MLDYFPFLVPSAGIKCRLSKTINIQLTKRLKIPLWFHCLVAWSYKLLRSTLKAVFGIVKTKNSFIYPNNMIYGYWNTESCSCYFFSKNLEWSLLFLKLCDKSTNRMKPLKVIQNMHARCDMPASCFIRSNANRKVACSRRNLRKRRGHRGWEKTNELFSFVNSHQTLFRVALQNYSSEPCNIKLTS